MIPHHVAGRGRRASTRPRGAARARSPRRPRVPRGRSGARGRAVRATASARRARVSDIIVAPGATRRGDHRRGDAPSKSGEARVGDLVRARAHRVAPARRCTRRRLAATTASRAHLPRVGDVAAPRGGAAVLGSARWGTRGLRCWAGLLQRASARTTLPPVAVDVQRSASRSALVARGPARRRFAPALAGCSSQGPRSGRAEAAARAPLPHPVAGELEAAVDLLPARKVLVDGGSRLDPRRRAAAVHHVGPPSRIALLAPDGHLVGNDRRVGFVGVAGPRLLGRLDGLGPIAPTGRSSRTTSTAPARRARAWSWNSRAAFRTCTLVSSPRRLA